MKWFRLWQNCLCQFLFSFVLFEGNAGGIYRPQPQTALCPSTAPEHSVKYTLLQIIRGGAKKGEKVNLKVNLEVNLKYKLTFSPFLLLLYWTGFSCIDNSEYKSHIPLQCMTLPALVGYNSTAVRLNWTGAINTMRISLAREFRL